MITCDVVDILCDRLYSPNEQIKFASAVTLGYLSYNRTASRLLLHNCRNVTHLFNTLMSILRPETKISRQFVESYETELKLGLPKLLVRNKVKFYDSINPEFGNPSANVNSGDEDYYDNNFQGKLSETGSLKFINMSDCISNGFE